MADSKASALPPASPLTGTEFFAGVQGGADVKITAQAIADLSPSPVKASGAEVRTGTDDAKFVTTKSIYDAAAPVALTDAATVAVDLATGINFTLTLGGNRTLGAPSNAKPGASGVIIVKQDATGSRTLAYNTAWKFFGGSPTLSTAANAVDMISYFVETSGILRCGIAKASA